MNDYSNLLGYLACGLVFVTFYLRSAVGLRSAAAASNLAFIAYALAAGLLPILLLHLMLLPLNLLRLRQVLAGRVLESPRSPASGAAASAAQSVRY
jgi:hypothetical protein